MKRMKRFSRTLAALAMMCVMSIMCINVQAADLSELQQQKEEAERKKEEAEAILSQLDDEKSDIISTITELDKKIAEYNAQIVELEEQAAALQTEITATQGELAAAQVQEAEQYEAMKRRIQYSYENGNIDYLDTVFSSTDIADVVNKSEYAEQIYNYDSNMLKKLVAIRLTIAEYETQLEDDLAAVETIEAELEGDREAIEIMLEGKQRQAANYSDAMDVYEAQIAQLQKDIENTDAAIAAEEERRRQAALQAAAAGQDVPVYYTGGRFQWPVSSGGYVSSNFGPRWGRMHNGIDIACPTGTPILAGETGTVITTAYSASMGNYVVIDHGGGVSTVYMHNTSFAVSPGTVVSRGQVIAYAGSTGNSTGPHCHFAVRINGVYVNPAPYL